MGKFSLFAQALTKDDNTFLVIVAVLGSAISIAYYLRLIIAMFFFKETTFKTSEKVTVTYNIVAVVIIASLVILGVFLICLRSSSVCKLQFKKIKKPSNSLEGFFMGL